MPYIDPAVVAKAKELDLLTYLQTYEPHELKKMGSVAYCTRTHDSLKISNGKWYWHSRDIGGRSALDFLIKVRGLRFTEAVEQIMGRVAMVPPALVSSEEPQNDFALPTKNATSKRMMNYLTSRGIDPCIIKYCYDRGLLYESAPYSNAVFVGRDENGIARYAAMRGAKFVGEAAGSQKRYSFGVTATGPSDTVHLFESPIDLLSYATLRKLHGRDPWRDSLLSLSGVSKSGRALPAALDRHLEHHPGTQSVVCRLDNDDIGHGAAAGIAVLLDGRCEVESKPPPQCKDYNDYLCQQLNRQRNRKRVLER